MHSLVLKRLLVGCSLLLLCGPAASWAEPAFITSCLGGRYTTTTTGFDESNSGVPFAVAGYVNFTCLGQRKGNYSGTFIITYPTLVSPPVICNVTQGSYTIDENTGLITATATLGPTTPSCNAAFSNTTLSESGFLSDPKAATINLVETGQGGNDIIPYIFTRAPTN